MGHHGSPSPPVLPFPFPVDSRSWSRSHGRHCMTWSPNLQSHSPPLQSRPPSQWTPSPTPTTQPFTLHLYDYDWRMFTLEKTERNIFPHYDKTERNLFHLISFYSSDLHTVVKTTKYTSVFHSFHTVYDKMSVFTPLGDLSTPLKKVNILTVKKTLFLTFSPRSVIFVIENTRFPKPCYFYSIPNFHKMAIFTLFSQLWKITQNTTFPKIPKNVKNGVFQEMPQNGQNWDILENGVFGRIPKNGQNQGIPQNAQKWQKWGFPGNTQKWQFWCGGGDDPLEHLM